MFDFTEIQRLLDNGNWADAIREFQRINPTGRDFGDALESITDVETLRDIALLGFYAREYKPKEC